MSATKRIHHWPKGHWSWPIKVTHKHGLRDREMLYVGGQVDLDQKGNVLRKGDLAGQAKAVVGHIGTVLEGLGADLKDVVKLLAFYQNDGSRDEDELLAAVGRLLPKGARPVITAVPLPALAYPGLLVEIEAVAMRGEKGERLKAQAIDVAGLAPLPKPFAHAVRVAEMIYTSGLSAFEKPGRLYKPGDLIAQSKFVMERLSDALKAFGADHDDACKINIYYTGGGHFEDWEGAARTRAAYFKEPGRAAPSQCRQQDPHRACRHARDRRQAPAAHARLAQGPLGLADPPALQARPQVRPHDLRRRAGGADAEGRGPDARRPRRADKDLHGDDQAGARGVRREA
jgi:enamine deaminase RidA (YjgF/YER057c/UK114 family)